MAQGSEVVVAACGIDLSPFESGPQPGQIDSQINLRSELGIPDRALVIGHVGRFFAVKNHGFVVEIAEEVLKKVPNTVFLLVGWGPLQEQIEADIRRRGLQDRCRILGERRDVPELMMQVFDALVLPSRIEGVPVTMFEAQAAGIPCVISDRVSRSAQVVPELVHYMSLAESPSMWAEALVASVSQARGTHRSAALAFMSDSPANIRVCVERIQEVYERSVLASALQP
jgi:glycosyltransferase EpsF